MNIPRKQRVLILAVLISAGLTACQKDSAKTAAANDGRIPLNYTTYRVGTHLSAPLEQTIINRFNEQYGKEIRLNIEELPSDSVYNDKMKVLAVSDELPDIIDGKDGLRDILIQSGKAVDLRPYLDADPEFRDVVIGEDCIAANTMPDGSIYSVFWACQLAGYYYNKDMFAKAGITPAETWDEWFSNCDKLLSAGFTPLALMTGENSWTTNLILGAMIASQSEAAETMMNTRFPSTYQTPEVIKALGWMQTCLQKYTTPDALGALYANAANNFLMEQAAIISNGSWMIADFSNPEKASPGLADRVGFALFPGGGVMRGYAEGFTIVKSSPEKQEAAFKFLKVTCSRETQLDRIILTGELPIAADLQITDEIRRKNPLIAAAADAAIKAKYAYPNLSVTAYAGVIDAFGRYYPELAAGTISPEQMAAKLDEAAAGAR
ncbi:MAG: extracellular solute-binding protein [Spirochaetaceae bacterium]|jgi:raffinose/stachyose/melibiose transport system substrate-binding protein|nr:extracellular solute-binding protein [Spirochaetaceae bacterium]